MFLLLINGNAKIIFVHSLPENLAISRGEKKEHSVKVSP